MKNVTTRKVYQQRDFIILIAYQYTMLQVDQYDIHVSSVTDILSGEGSRSKSITIVGGRHAKGKAGLETSRKKVVDNDSESTEPSSLNSDSDRDGKADSNGEGSDEGMGQNSDDDFDQAKLSEKDAKRVLNDEVMFLFN